jgi:hypothetical protein
MGWVYGLDWGGPRNAYKVVRNWKTDVLYWFRSCPFVSSGVRTIEPLGVLLSGRYLV